MIFGSPKLSGPLNIASYGAGVDIPETGQGYYYGGWISNASMHEGSQGRKFSSSLYKFRCNTDKTELVASPDTAGRVDGTMVLIPAGETGPLVYLRGSLPLSPSRDGTRAPQPLDEALLYGPAANTWYTQKTSGVIPQLSLIHI